jgi:hypothetical protein
VFEFNEKSLKILETCHSDLQAIFEEIIKNFCCIITKGFYDESSQNKDYSQGITKHQWPNGKHNTFPSLSIDAYPSNACLHPQNQREKNLYIQMMSFFGGRVIETANALLRDGKISHKLIWGAGIGEDFDTEDHNFLDYAHFELIPIVN